MTLPTTASEALRLLHATTTDTDLCIHILRIDPSHQTKTSTISLRNLSSGFDEDIAHHKAGWHQHASVHLWPKGATSRDQSTAACVDVLFLDLDIASESHPNRPTTSEDALSFLLEDCPIMPTLVTSSGRGVHAFYCLAEPLWLPDEHTRTNAAQLVRQFQSAMHSIARERHGWTFDPVADMARVHRIPFSTNLKPDVNADCVPMWAGQRIDLSTIKQLVQDNDAGGGVVPAPRPTGGDATKVLHKAEAKWAATRKDNSTAKNPAAIFEGCRFLRHAFHDATTLSEPEWHAATNILAKCEDGQTLVHAFSQPHASYSWQESERKLQAGTDSPPVGCEHISNKLGFDGCGDCPFKGRMQSPLTLGSRSSALAKLLATHAYVGNANAFVSLLDMDADPMTPEKFRRFHAGPGMPGNADDLFVKDSLANKVSQRAWRPDVADRIYWEGERRLLNTYVAPEHTVAPENPTRFFSHLEYLVPEDDERQVLIGYLAHLVQRPADKITYAMTLLSPQGAGKTYLHEVMSRVLGTQNVRVINGRSLDDRFRRHMAGRVLLILEEVSMADKSETYEGLKALITNEADEFEAKYMPMETMQTPRGVMLFTNHAHALYLPQDDRRFFVIRCSGPHPDGPAYYDALYADLNSPAFVAGVHHELSGIDLSGFNAKRPPFVTSAKRQMMENSRSEIDVLVGELMEAGEPPFDRDLATWDDLRAAVRGHRHSDASLTDKQIKRALYDRGYQIDPQGRQCPVDGRRVRLCMRNASKFAAMTAAELAMEYADQKRGQQRSYYVEGNVLSLAANT